MDYILTKFGECVLMRICIAGELDYKTVLQSDLVSKRYAGVIISKMLHEHILTKHIYSESGQKVLRLSMINGTKAANELAPELLAHYQIIINKPEQPYGNHRREKERFRRIAKLTDIIFQNGVQVDFLTYNYIGSTACWNQKMKEYILGKGKGSQSLFREENSCYTPEELFGKLGSEKSCYFTKRALLQASKERSQYTRQLTMSRAYGILTYKRAFYTVYYMEDERELWKASTEQIFNEILKDSKTRATNVRHEGKGAAIFYMPTAEKFSRFITRKKEEQSKIKPEVVYEEAYFLALNENHVDMLQLFLIPNWKEKLNQHLFRDAAVTGQLYDATLKGRETYNLLSNDLIRMKQIKKMKPEDATLVIHPWQKPLIEELRLKNAAIIEIPGEDFNDLILKLSDAET